MKTLLLPASIFILSLVLHSCSTEGIESPAEYKVSDKTKKILTTNKPLSAYNHEYKTRDAILGISSDWDAIATDTSRNFDSLTVQKLDELIAGKFIDPDKSYHGAPTPREFLDFMITHPALTLHGYAGNPTRQDYRISLRGLYVNSTLTNPMMKKDFQQFCEEADSLYTENVLYSRWD
ncbi:MAG: hypothetical protein ACJ75J_14635 [Cytophagaceae bacterium]